VIKAAKGRADDMDRAIDAIRAGGDPNARDEYNLTAFIWCARITQPRHSTPIWRHWPDGGTL